MVSGRSKVSGKRKLSGVSGTSAASGIKGASDSNASSGSNASRLSASLGSNPRISILVALFVVFALALLVRLVFLTVVVSDEYTQNAVDSRLSEITIEARRGTIYDRNGNVLACSVDATTIYAIPSEVQDAQGTANILGALLGKDINEIKEKLSTDSTFAYISRKEKVEVANQVRDMQLDGIYFLDDSRREYPYAQSGGSVVGFVNMDGVGVSGLESYYNDILSGVDGVRRIERGVDGVVIMGGTNSFVSAVDGQDIMVSLDIEMQIQLEKTLKSWKENLKVDTQAMLMDATTGEIYAAGSTPQLNPAKTDNIETGATELTLVSSAYEPGSIFKTVPALAVLEEGAMGTEDTIDCPSTIEADGYVVSDAHARADTTYTFREVIEKSSNVGISLITDEKIGFRKMYDRILEYGFGEKTGVDYPGESSGYVTDIDTWSTIQRYNVTFGQGLSATPMQMSRVYGALVNNGVACTPHFLIAYPKSGEAPKYSTKQIIHNQKTITDMTSMLQSVVSTGTAQAAQIDGFEPAGKTGTAEVANNEGGYYEDIYNVSFVGYLPNTTSNFVCFTGAIQQPAEGNTSGMFRDIMTYAIERYNITSTN